MSKSAPARRTTLGERGERTIREVKEFVTDRGQLGVIQAPPGSGKTWLLVEAVVAARDADMRVAVAAQTNSQADEICRRLSNRGVDWQVIRFAGGGATQRDLGDRVIWTTDKGDLPNGPAVVVGTSAKWGMIDLLDPFDVLLIDEAWQMAWADFMLLGQVAEHFVLIGDPGQIPPVVTIQVSRWETAPRAPHVPAPEAVLADSGIAFDKWDMPATRRLPSDTADLVRPFYDFPFDAFAEPGERQVLFDDRGSSVTERGLDLLRVGTVTGFTIPTPDSGPPLERDDDVARVASKMVQQLLRRKGRIRIDGKVRELCDLDIGISSTHRAMNSALDLALPGELRRRVVVDTPERWQGLERPVMIVVHPLSGTLQPSAFDLETGRLCVMASRHTAGMIVIARDHLTETLNSSIPVAGQPFGRKDVEGRGLRDNLHFWSQLHDGGRLVDLR